VIGESKDYVRILDVRMCELLSQPRIEGIL